MLRLLPLGGLGEIGKNCLLIDDGQRAIMIDCGVTFREQAYGVDVIHPAFPAALLDRLCGVFLTHGHEDHIGALPYLLKRYDVPVFGPPYALAVARARLAEHGLEAMARLSPFEPRRPVQLGSFEIEPLRVAHSVVDACGLFVRTTSGTLLHTGDFKFDARDPYGHDVDAERIAEVARAESIALLLSDSTNAMVEGSTEPEVEVHRALEEVIAGAKGTVIVAMFASNVARVQGLFSIAARAGRKIALLGRSMQLHAEAGQRTGYLQWADGARVSPTQLREIPREKLLVLATGSQGEARAALARLARDEHPDLRVREGDRIVLSARAIPGHEVEVDALLDALLRRGAELYTTRTHPRLHTSGHARREELSRMIELAEPRAFVPVHGGRQQLEAHAQLARDLGVEQLQVIENGASVQLDPAGSLERGEPFEANVVRRVEGRELPAEVVQERRRVAEHGQVLVLVRRCARGELDGEPVAASTGLVDERGREALEAAVRRQVRRELAGLGRAHDDRAFLEAARLAARRAVVSQLGVKPESKARLLP